MLQTETTRKLRRRAEENDETYDDVIDRLLNETAVEVELEEIVQAATEQYDTVPQVAIQHTQLTEPAELEILVWGGSCVEEELDCVPTGATVVISQNDDTLRLPVRVQGRGYLPPSRNSRDRTTVYLNTDEESVDIETGVQYFKEKIRNPGAWEEGHTGNPFEPLEIE